LIYAVLLRGFVQIPSGCLIRCRAGAGSLCGFFTALNDETQTYQAHTNQSIESKHSSYSNYEIFQSLEALALVGHGGYVRKNKIAGGMMPPAIEMSYLHRLKSQSWLADWNIVPVYPISTTLVVKTILGFASGIRRSDKRIDVEVERALV
jgi:hypothetical protein